MTSSNTRSYKDLDCWREAVELLVVCHRLASRFPRREGAELAVQLRRAVISIPSNIAEGNGSRSRGNYVRYLCIAHASLMEVESHLHVASRLGFLSQEALAAALGRSREVGRLLGGLIRSLAPR